MDQVSANESLDRIVRDFIDSSLKSSQFQHPDRAPSCPPVGVLVDLIPHRINNSTAIHAAACGYCRSTLREALLISEEQYSNDWACAEEVATWRYSSRTSNSEVTTERAARAFLAARHELGERAVTEQVREHLEDLATILAQELFDRDHAAADSLLRIAHSLRNSPLLPPRQETVAFSAIMTSLVSQWAAQRGSLDDFAELRIARDLYLTIGEPANAALCAWRLGNLLYKEDHVEHARAEFAFVCLRTDDDRLRADAEAAVGRTSAELGYINHALIALATAERLYRAVGDRTMADSVLAHMASIEVSNVRPSPSRSTRAMTEDD